MVQISVNRDAALEKYAKLKSILSHASGLLVAYSGGVDSTFLAYTACKVLPGKTLPVFIESPLSGKRQLRWARETATALGIPLQVLEDDTLSDELVARNTPERCYWCKKRTFIRLRELAVREGCTWVGEGSNIDDEGDYRPGLRALRELEIRSPLREAGLTKDEIRSLSRDIGLPTWDRPSYACLASRIPYHIELTATLLEKIGNAEEILFVLGFSRFRVRHHGEVARIEVDRGDLERFMERELREKVVKGLREAGYRFITLDLSGYRTGSMNEGLDLTTMERKTNETAG